MPSPLVKEPDIKTYADDFARNKRSFILSPKQWKQFTFATQLNWKSQPFTKNSITIIPECRGVYAHSISVGIPNMPPTNYITYVGLVGDQKKVGPAGAKRNLRQRFQEYLKESVKLGRPLVWDMLSEYDGHMLFHYAEIPDYSISLHQIETALLDALLPPCNTGDFSINIKQAHQIAYRR
jgi:hypothetical protein